MRGGSPEDRRRWAAWLLERNRRGTRISAWLVLALYPAFGLLDAALAPRAALPWLLGTRALVTATSVLMLWVSRRPLFEAHANLIAPAFIVLGATGISFRGPAGFVHAVGVHFHAAHEEAYGYRDPEGEVELVTLRATATEPGPEIDPAAVGRTAAGAERSRRDTLLGDTEIVRGEPEPGETIDGPAIVELPEATLAVPEGWKGEVLDSGTVRLTWTR